MRFSEYQAKAQETAAYPREAALLYPALGLAGEAGEVLEKVLKGVFPDGPPQGWDAGSMWLRTLWKRMGDFVEAAAECQVIKKQVRDKAETLPAGVLEEIKARVEGVGLEAREGIGKELGGCLWYAAATCTDIDFGMENVARANLEQLALRKARGCIGGSGDYREQQ